MALGFGACDTKNPVGFWDIVRITVEAGGEKQEQEDLGSMEFLDDDSLIWILRYDPIDPATGEEDWFAPIHPPLRGTGNYESFDEETLSASLDELWINTAEMEEYQGSTMIYSGGDVSLGTTPVEFTLELAR